MAVQEETFPSMAPSGVLWHLLKYISPPHGTFSMAPSGVLWHLLKYIFPPHGTFWSTFSHYGTIFVGKKWLLSFLAAAHASFSPIFLGGSLLCNDYILKCKSNRGHLPLYGTLSEVYFLICGTISLLSCSSAVYFHPWFIVTFCWIPSILCSAHILKCFKQRGTSNLHQYVIQKYSEVKFTQILNFFLPHISEAHILKDIF